MRETWCVMADGTYGDPREIRAGADGVLRHGDGRAVAYAPHGPRSRSIDVAAVQAKASEPVEPVAPPATEPPARDVTAAEGAKPAPADREIKPSGNGRTYRTRGGKAD